MVGLADHNHRAEPVDQPSASQPLHVVRIHRLGSPSLSEPAKNYPYWGLASIPTAGIYFVDSLAFDPVVGAGGTSKA